MKLITANKLNRLWQNGFLPKLGLKIDKTKVLTTIEQVSANTNPENIAGAAVAKELINNLVSDVYVGDDGKLHKIKGGADTVLNFSQLSEESLVFISPQLQCSANQGQTLKQEYNIHVEKNRKYLFVYYQSSAQKNITITVSKDAISETLPMNKNTNVSNISTALYEATETGQFTVTVNTKFSSNLSVYHAILLILG